MILERRLSVTNLSSENNLPTFWLNAPVVIRAKGAFSQNVSKLFSKLKLVTDNLLSIYAAANWEATESNDPIWQYRFSLKPRLLGAGNLFWIIDNFAMSFI